jgi:anthranilate phosphoribosyltransferase
MTTTLESAGFIWPDVLSTLVSGADLRPAEASWVMDQIMTGAADEAKIAGFAMALRAKGESPAEIGALTQVMLRHAPQLPDLPDRVVDVVGTGGDKSGTVNFSTMAAVVVAAAGVPVAKHGNRAASSQCGSADLLEELGIAIDLPPAAVAQCIHQAGIGFCFAPVFHAGLRHAASARRALGVPTVFNFLGPLTNPARPTALALGCANLRMAPIMAQVLADRRDTALVFRGEDGLDEFTTTGSTRIWLVTDSVVREFMIDAADLGIAHVKLSELHGGDAKHNASVARAVFAGESGPISEMVALNAAAALAAYYGLSTVDSKEALLTVLKSHLDTARKVLTSKAAQTTLESWQAACLIDA